jgi:prevent-host-death family protein
MGKIAKAKVSAKNSVGIKELKDSASSIVEEVQRRRRAVTITKHGRAVARVVPIEADHRQQLEDLELIISIPKASWETLDLYRLGLDASTAIRDYLSKNQDAMFEYLTCDRKHHAAFSAEGLLGKCL